MTVVLMVNYIKNANLKDNLTYVFNQPPHSVAQISRRTLAVAGHNINMLRDPKTGEISRDQNGSYFAVQMRNVINHALHPGRLHGTTSIIVAFAEDSFDTSMSDIQTQADQALALVNGYALKYFSDAQFVIGIQADNANTNDKGVVERVGLIHAHLIVNQIKPVWTVSQHARIVNTDNFTVNRQRSRINAYMKANFRQVTGRAWTNSHKTLGGSYTWELVLKNAINAAKSVVNNFSDFQLELLKYDTVAELKGDGHITYKIQSKGKTKRRRDWIKNRQGKWRGLGKEYTLSALKKYWEQKNN